MRPEQTIEVQLIDGTGQRFRIGNVVLTIHFFTSGNLRYGFAIGRTDNDGHLSVSYNDIERLRRRNAHENLMDYNTPLGSCDPKICVVILSDLQLREQFDKAVRFYGKPPDWATHWPSNSRVKPVSEPVMLIGDLISVQVRAE
jgi:hypothetical protein